MTVNDDCARQRNGIESLVAEHKSLTATTARTERQLASLKAAHADPATIASVRETLSAEQEQLAEIAVAGKAAVEEFQGECVGEPLPPGAAAFLQAATPATGRGADGPGAGTPRESQDRIVP
ncbi:hypothetical protein ABZW30_22680 [Kitasatospora sp. NPDC004669]|uniref:hypothetical protein n=1 Tax=Kitasatospora sp. NPDC004669 TaxID=3154555 RepID=UPI0033B05968